MVNLTTRDQLQMDKNQIAIKIPRHKKPMPLKGLIPLQELKICCIYQEQKKKTIEGKIIKGA